MGCSWAPRTPPRTVRGRAHAWPARSAALFLAGWIVCIVSLAWQASGIGVHEHFNHNDIFHSIFFVGLAVVASGLLARVTEDRRQAEDELKGVQV